jgi:hypothetical protein
MSTSMSKESIGIQPIHIRFNTNANNEPDILTHKMIYLHTNPADTETQSQQNTHKLTEYPFFTDQTKLNITKILKLPRKEQIDIFFNKDKFKDLVGTNFTTDKDERSKNAEDNLVTMINIFFPTVFPIQTNISETFSENIQNTLFEPSVQNNPNSSILGDLFGKENVYGYLNTGTLHTVTKITIVNDIINDPYFNGIILPSINFHNWQKETIERYNKSSSNAFENIKKTIDTHFDNIKNTLSNPTSTAHEDYMKIQKTTLALNRDASHPPILLVPFFKILLTLNKTDINKIIDVFIQFYILTSKAVNKPNYIPYSIFSINGFQTLYNNSIKYAIEKGIKESISNLSIAFEYMKKINKKENFPTDLEKEIAQKVNSFKELTSFKELMRKYKSPMRSYSNQLLDTLLNESISNNQNYLTFIQFLKNVTIEERPQDKYLSDSQMINKLKTGIMSIREKKSSSTKTKEEEDVDPLSEKTNKYYDCFISIEVLKELLNDQNVSDIMCSYRNDFLVHTYEKLKSKKKNPFLFYNNIPVFDMAKYTKKNRNSNSKMKGGFIPRSVSISSLKNKSLSSIKINVPNKKGKKYTRKNNKYPLKYSVYNQNTI